MGPGMEAGVLRSPAVPRLRLFSAGVGRGGDVEVVGVVGVLAWSHPRAAGFSVQLSVVPQHCGQETHDDLEGCTTIMAWFEVRGRAMRGRNAIPA